MDSSVQPPDTTKEVNQPLGKSSINSLPPKAIINAHTAVKRTKTRSLINIFGGNNEAKANGLHFKEEREFFDCSLFICHQEPKNLQPNSSDLVQSANCQNSAASNSVVGRSLSPASSAPVLPSAKAESASITAPSKKVSSLSSSSAYLPSSSRVSLASAIQEVLPKSIKNQRNPRFPFKTLPKHFVGRRPKDLFLVKTKMLSSQTPHNSDFLKGNRHSRPGFFIFN
uniref:Uncharacterized protein n=1 Tax=Cucumis melo TaxID=3656 RepID=A0A9I9EC71_CUCME